MKTLVVGAGGREHALAWKLAQSPRVQTIFVAPGNAGTDQLATNVPIPATKIKDLVSFAEEKIDLTVVGPEAPLAAGLVDAFTAQGFRYLGLLTKRQPLKAVKYLART